jgi:hypothetical protein
MLSTSVYEPEDMRPFAVLIGMVSGSAASITFGPCAASVGRPLSGVRPAGLPQDSPAQPACLVAGDLTAGDAGSFVAGAKQRSRRGRPQSPPPAETQWYTLRRG